MSKKPENYWPKKLAKEKLVPLEQLPWEWKKVIKELSAQEGIVFLLGAADTGKTTFALAFATFLGRQGIKVGMVDADVGQSTFGPPTTISLVTSAEPLENFRSLQPQSLYFVGDNSPRDHFLPLIVGTKKMVEKAEKAECNCIIVDTSGLITHPYGTTLKYHKIDLIQPQYIVAFEREKELEDIFSAILGNQGFELSRLKVPPEVKKISPSQRYERRKKEYRRYFSSAKEIELSRDSILIYPPKMDLLKGESPLNLVVGLRGEAGETLGIGILTQFTEKSVKVLTPLSSSKKISTLVLGTLKVEPSGEEVGRISPLRLNP